MKFKVLLVFALTMLFVPSVLAQSHEEEEISPDILAFVLQQKQAEINEGLAGANIPGPLKAFLNGKYNIVIDDTTIGIEMAGGKMKTVQDGGLAKPTTTFYTTGETFTQIVLSDDKMGAVLQNLQNGNIKREDHSIGAKVKGTVLSFALKLLPSLFG
jgi:hypothetical protein